MNKFSGLYRGNLRSQIKHIPSGSQIETDAPKDNQGKGELFSPTDLLASALGTCMVTIIAIRARDQNINLENIDFEIEKIMQSAPRKVAKIKLQIKLKATLTKEQRNYLESEGLNCPVALSLNPDLKQEVTFVYD